MTIILPPAPFRRLPTLAEGLSAPLDAWSGGYQIILSPPVGHETVIAARFYSGLILLRCQVVLEEEATARGATTFATRLKITQLRALFC